MATPDNQEIINKAVIASDELASAGALNDAQGSKFLDWVVDEARLTEFARVVRFRNPNFKIESMSLGRRVAVAAQEAKDPLVRRGVSTSKRICYTSDVVVPFEITDKFGEINLQGMSVKDRIVQMMAAQTSNNIEELMLLGNSTATPAIIEAEHKTGGSTTKYIEDQFLALNTGWMEYAYEGHVVDAGGETIGLGIFGEMQRAMPTKYRRRMSDMRILMSPDLWSLYQERISGRATALGDAVAGGAEHKPFSMTAFPVPLFELHPQTTQHVTLNGVTAVALRSTNISDVVVLPSDLGESATTPYILDTDYTVNLSAGTITRIGGGAITDGQTVKVQYKAAPQAILVHRDNLIIGLGRDISIEKDRNIYGRVDEYAIHLKVGVQIQDPDAIVVVKNIGTGV